MAIEKVVEVKVSAKDAEKELKRLNDILEEQEDITIKLQREQFELERQLKNTPKNALAAQKDLRDELDHVKDSIKDQSLSVKELKLEQKRLGSGTSDLTEEFTQNGGAMGLLNELTGGLAQRFKDSYEAIALSSKGLSGFKKALIATGIGAAVVAVGLLATNWESVKNAITGVTLEQTKLNEAQEAGQIAVQESSRQTKIYRDIVLDTTQSEAVRSQALVELSKSVTELNGVTLEQEDALKKVTEATDPYIKAVEARAKAEAFAKIIAEEQANIIREQNKPLEEQIGFWDAVSAGVTGFGNTAKTASDLASRGIENQQEKVSELTSLIALLQEQYDEAIISALGYENQLNNTTQAAARSTVETVSVLTSEGIQSVSDTTTSGIEAVEVLSTRRQSLSDTEIENMQNEQKWAEMTQSQKAGVYAQGLNNLSTTLGKESAAGKAAAIAGATVSTYQAATDSYKSLSGIPIIGPVLGAVAAAAAVVAGIANVRAIKSTKTPGPSVGGGSTPSVSTPKPPPSRPPSFNIVGSTGTNQLAEVINSQTGQQTDAITGAIGSQTKTQSAAIAEQSSQPIKAYVVGSEVSGQQELDRKTTDEASIG